MCSHFVTFIVFSTRFSSALEAERATAETAFCVKPYGFTHYFTGTRTVWCTVRGTLSAPTKTRKGSERIERVLAVFYSAPDSQVWSAAAMREPTGDSERSRAYLRSPVVLSRGARTPKASPERGSDVAPRLSRRAPHRPRPRWLPWRRSRGGRAPWRRARAPCSSRRVPP